MVDFPVYCLFVLLAITVTQFPTQTLACFGSTRVYYVTEPPSDATTTPSIITTKKWGRRLKTSDLYYYYNDDEEIATPRRNNAAIRKNMFHRKPSHIFKQQQRPFNPFKFVPPTAPTLFRKVKHYKLPFHELKPFMQITTTENNLPETTTTAIEIVTPTTETAVMTSRLRLRRRRTTSSTVTTEEVTTSTAMATSGYQCGFNGAVNKTTSKATPDEVPWQARLVIAAAGTPDQRPRMCGAALIADGRALITAASCFNNVDTSAARIKVVLGKQSRSLDKADGEQVSAAIKIFVHNLYVPGSFNNDIAIVQIDQIKITEAVFPVCLPGPCRAPRSSDHCLASGWRTVSHGTYTFDSYAGSPNLHKTEAKLIQRQSRCISAASESDRPFNETQLICATVTHPGIFGYCHADWGGPIVCRPADSSNFAIEGVLAYHTSCDSPDSVDVYLRACRFHDWIEEIVNDVIAN